jgi:hypothetical protein
MLQAGWPGLSRSLRRPGCFASGPNKAGCPAPCVFCKGGESTVTSSAQQSFGDSESTPMWQPRFYNFNVWTEHKRVEKLRYKHRTVKRGPGAGA